MRRHRVSRLPAWRSTEAEAGLHHRSRSCPQGLLVTAHSLCAVLKFPRRHALRFGSSSSEWRVVPPLLSSCRQPLTARGEIV